MTLALAAHGNGDIQMAKGTLFAMVLMHLFGIILLHLHHTPQH